MLTRTEENYLKAIYKVSERDIDMVNTNAIAAITETAAASVTDMLKRLAEKELIIYQKYRGVKLTKEGSQIATGLIRRHRLWEYFLVEKLNFPWEDIHDIAEELEHVKSQDLIDRLDKFLDFPKYDPHGDPIPNAEGKFTIRPQTSLDSLDIGQTAVLLGVKIHNRDFLGYLNQVNIALGVKLTIEEKYSYDSSIKLKIDDGDSQLISEMVSQNLLVKSL
jgi:DtxR family Mn-dependent transcriptional regulator